MTKSEQNRKARRATWLAETNEAVRRDADRQYFMSPNRSMMERLVITLLPYSGSRADVEGLSRHT